MLDQLRNVEAENLVNIGSMKRSIRSQFAGIVVGAIEKFDGGRLAVHENDAVFAGTELSGHKLDAVAGFVGCTPERGHGQIISLVKRFARAFGGGADSPSHAASHDPSGSGRTEGDQARRGRVRAGRSGHS